MSDDIVARLRDCTCVPHGEICREAADEIDRLRKDRDELEQWINAQHPFWRLLAGRRDAMRGKEKRSDEH